MNNMLKGMITMAIGMQIEMDYMKESRKSIILERWEESKKMPRKMKKKVRKSILLDWSIACYDPFEGMYKF